MLAYVDDCIILARSNATIDAIIKTLMDDYELTDEGKLDKYLGIEITDNKDGSFEMSQPYLIQRIIEFVGLDMRMTNTRDTPVGKPLLHKDLQGLPRKTSFNYRGAIGMLSYLQGNTRPELAMAVHQSARFSNAPMLSHERAVKRIAKYLLKSPTRDIIYKPDP